LRVAIRAARGGKVELRVPQRRSCPLRGVALLARLEVVTSCNRKPGRCVTLTACVATRCSAPLACRGGNGGLAARSGAGPLHSAVAPPGRSGGVSGVWSARRGSVQSTFVEAPWCGSSCSRTAGTFTAGLPARERRRGRSGRLIERRGCFTVEVTAQATLRIRGSGSDPDQRVPGDDLVHRLAVAADAGPLAESLRETACRSSPPR